MNWRQSAPTGLADAISERMTRGLVTAYAENARRHAPEMGDGGLEFGLLVSGNARHLVAVELDDLAGVEVIETGNRWWMQYDRDGRRHRVFLYKAPPGASTVDDLLLNDSEIKLALTTENAAQLALFAEDEAGSPQLTNLVVAHYGDHIGGFHHALVGAPYVEISADRRVRRVRWAWDERLDVPSNREGVRRDQRTSESLAPGSEFGLQLRKSTERRSGGGGR